MHSRVLSFIVAAVAYGITLTIAALLLPGMHISFLWAVIAWVLFTVSITLIRPLLTRVMSAHVRSFTWVIGIATVLVSLIITALLSPRSGFRIDNFITWVLATVIVWLGTLVYDAVDDRVFKSRPATAGAQTGVDERTMRQGGATNPGGTAGPTYIPPTTPGMPPPTGPTGIQPDRPPEQDTGGL